MSALMGPPPGERVLLVNMPWGLTEEPSAACGLLKSVLASHGIGCDVLEAPMRLLRYIKKQTYRDIGQTWAVNEFVFTSEFEPEPSPEQLELLRRTFQDEEGRVPVPEAFIDRMCAKILRLRQDVVPRFLDDLMEEIDFSRYALVGFTCLFDQNMASLSLARRIKRLYPDLMIAFGGYALHRPVGPALQRGFPEMDVVSYGDGEPVMFPLWEAACGRRPLSEVPNITFRNDQGRVVDSDKLVKISLDDSPTPDYDDFFLQREELLRKHGIEIPVGEITAESSRGCWYGEKNHCIFCGIDDETLKYRVKSARIVIEQMDQLHRRYNVTHFRFPDDIMPFRYFKDFVPEMVRRGGPYTMMYETKANMKASQIEVSAQAGIRYFQPGIESFSTPVLKLMDKGVSAAQNVFTIYTMCRHGIQPLYNLIYGFPFEEPAHYLSMLKLLPSLYHLFPPMGVAQVVIMRYAPLSEDPKRFGAEGPLKADWRNRVIFSTPYLESLGLIREELCYYFESPYNSDTRGRLRPLYDLLYTQFQHWKGQFYTGLTRLTYAESGEGLHIQDTRFSDPQEYHLGRVHAFIGEVLRVKFRGESQLRDELAGRGFSWEEGRAALDDLVAARIVVEIDGDYVWLALEEGAFEALAPRWSESARQNANVKSSREWEPRESLCAVLV